MRHGECPLGRHRPEPGTPGCHEGRYEVEMGSMVVNDVCGSGLMAVIVGANAIKAGEHEVVVVGGMESMNNAPYLLKRARFGLQHRRWPAGRPHGP